MCRCWAAWAQGDEVDVLVVGAGPTGLAAAVEALRHGLTVRIVDRKPGRGTFSKALVVHARTMEVFAIMGISREIRDAGLPLAALNLYFDNGKKCVHVDLLDQPWGTPPTRIGFRSTSATPNEYSTII